jgi:hypothetical protein
MYWRSKMGQMAPIFKNTCEGVDCGAAGFQEAFDAAVRGSFRPAVSTSDEIGRLWGI